MNHAAADARGASMRTSKSGLTIRLSGTAFHSDTYKGSQINTAPDISFRWVAGEAVEVDSVTTRPFVFFDLGGTLVDLRGIVTSMASRLQAIHVRGPIPLALLWATKTAASLPTATGPKFRSEREIATEVLAELLEDRNREKALEEATRLVREAWDGYVQRCALHPDVSVAWLRALRSKVSGLGIVTDGDTEAVAGVLAHTNLKGAFDSVTISEEVRTYKPDPRMYPTAMEILGSFVVTPSSSEAGKPDGKARARTDRSPGGCVHRAHRELCASDFEDRGRFEPNVGFEFRVHARGLSVSLRGFQFFRQGEQGLVVEARPELARRSEEILLIVVRGHQKRSVRAGAFPTACERADDHEIDRVAQRGAVFPLELDPLVSPRARIIRRVERFRHEAFASRLEGLVEERLGLLHVVRHSDGRVADPLDGLDDRFEGLAPLRVRPRGQVVLSAEEAVEGKQGDREFLRHSLHFRLPSSAPAHLLKREELARIRVDRHGLTLHDHRAIPDRVPETLDDLGELDGDVLEMAGEELDLVRRDVGLHAQSIVLVFEGGSPDSLEDRLERLEPFREHRADRTEELQVDLIEAIDALRCEDPRDFPEVGRHIVCPLDSRPIGLGREGGRECVDDRHVRDAEAHLSDHHADDVLRFPRGRVAQQFRQETDLPLLTAFTRFPSDRVEMLMDLRNGQRCRFQWLLPPRGNRLLGDEPEVSLLLPESGDARVIEAVRMSEDPHHHLLRESQLDSRVVGVNPALGQVDHLVEILLRRLP